MDRQWKQGVVLPEWAGKAAGQRVQYMERAGGMTHDLLVQAAGRLTFTLTFRPAWVSMVMRVKILHKGYMWGLLRLLLKSM